MRLRRRVRGREQTNEQMCSADTSCSGGGVSAGRSMENVGKRSMWRLSASYIVNDVDGAHSDSDVWDGRGQVGVKRAQEKVTMEAELTERIRSRRTC